MNSDTSLNGVTLGLVLPGHRTDRVRSGGYQCVTRKTSEMGCEKFPLACDAGSYGRNGKIGLVVRIGRESSIWRKMP